MTTSFAFAKLPVNRSYVFPTVVAPGEDRLELPQTDRARITIDPGFRARIKLVGGRRIVSRAKHHLPNEKAHAVLSSVDVKEQPEERPLGRPADR